jgi:hypothetical protein
MMVVPAWHCGRYLGVSAPRAGPLALATWKVKQLMLHRGVVQCFPGKSAKDPVTVTFKPLESQGCDSLWQINLASFPLFYTRAANTKFMNFATDLASLKWGGVEIIFRR